MDYKILRGINSPDDVKKLNKKEIAALCDEARQYIIETVSKNGGHLASSLGAVELTVALHRSFNSPDDAIIFDVGHQSYMHKLLTGRFEQFSTLRTKDGLSGFMRPCESIYDAFVTGHSSNSISAAYGIYEAKRIAGLSGTAVAVIGDGALTGGMAHEALNNVGSKNGNFIIVLNDNKMSISQNVGALARSLTKMRNKPRYHKVKFAISDFLNGVPFGKGIARFIFRVKEDIKNIIYRKNIFTCMGLNYLGPVDGHDIEAMEALFDVAQRYQRPTVIHVITTKGKGYKLAENSPNYYHGVAPFDVNVGAKASNRQTFSDVAGKTLCTLAEKDSKIVAITAAMTEGTGLSDFAARFPNQFFDVGIAEQHAVTFAAGLAKGGVKPFFVVYSSFLQRGFDQIIHDCAIEGLPVKLLVDRAGIVGEDGESHQGLFDVSYLSCIPKLNIYSPSCYNELEYMINNTAQNEELCAIRYPRGCEDCTEQIKYNGEDYTVLGDNKETLIIAYGRIFNIVNKIKAEKSDITVLKLNKIYPLSNEVVELINKYPRIVFFEESVERGSISEHLAKKLFECGYKGNYEAFTVKNEFVNQMSVNEALEDNGLDYNGILKKLEK